MEFISMRDFGSQTMQVWNKLANDEEIVITNNGKPQVFLVNIPEGLFDEVLAGIRHVMSQIEPRVRDNPSDKKAVAMQKVRDLLSEVDGNSIDLKQLQAERRAAKYERTD